MSWMRRSGRVKPLLNLHGIWRTGGSYPDTVAVAMQDGRVVYYHRQITATRIYVGKDRLPVLGRIAVGYQYKKSPLKKMTSLFQRKPTW